MDIAFDLRSAQDRRNLAAGLPKIDLHTFTIGGARFEELLMRLAEWLENPSWLVYQYGAVHLGYPERPRGPISLPTLLDLAVRLELLERFKGFDALLKNLRNVAQFHDTVFETRVAELFARLPTFRDITFGPECEVRGRLKRPDFLVTTSAGNLFAEAKVPKLHTQKAGQRFSREVSLFDAALDDVSWPVDLRLEVHIFGCQFGVVGEIAKRLVERALKNGPGQVLANGAILHIVPKSEPYALNELGFVANVLTPTEVTGPFNPKFTKLRVVNSALTSKIVTSIGATINDALSQLPVDSDGMIVLGEIPTKLTAKAIETRLYDPAYAHVRLFGSWYNPDIEFVFREPERAYLRRVFPGAG